MKIIYFLAFCTIQFFSFAQINIYLEGNIFESDSISVPFATVHLKNTKVAVTSNINGNFKLVLSKKHLPDTLMISHVSFKKMKMYISKNNIYTLEKIILEAKSNQIDVAEIKALRAKEIIKKVIERLDDNYFSDYNLDGFYRQKHKENNKYVRLIECFATVKKNVIDRKNEIQKESFWIRKIRRSNVYERNGDQHGDHFVDLMAEDPIDYSNSSFLNTSNIHNYKFSYIERNSDFIKIFFQNKPWKMLHNKSGYIIINKVDYAIIEVEIFSTLNSNYRENVKSNWKFQNGLFKAKYLKKRNKYYCESSSKYYNHYVENEQTESVTYIVEEYFDWITSRIHNDNISERFKLLTNLYSKAYLYNKNDWLNVPLIDQTVYKNLNEFKDVEEQFIDD